MKILYEDKYILIVYKEAGIPSQPDKSSEKSLIEKAEEYVNSPLYIMTRLDRPVKGIVLFAKDKLTADKLTKMIQNHQITKIYHAVVCGKVEKEGSLENYIMKNARLNISKIVNKGNVGAKPAYLDYKIIDEKDNLSKVEINLKTGRHHQIRVQFAHINAPLYGDTKYNPDFKHKRNVYPALCACTLMFNHPMTGEKIDVKIPDGLDM